MSKKILIVTKFFHPDITPRAFRAFELAKEFAKQGHKVTVLTITRDYDYQQLEVQFGIKIEATVKNEPKELSGGFIKKVIRFTLQYLFLYPHILLVKYFKNSLEIEESYDLLVSIAHPFSVHFAVAKALEKKQNLTKLWIADCGDPFAGGSEKRLPTPFYFHLIEKWFCKKPDFITIPIIEAKNAYSKACHSKIHVIPQGFDFSLIKPNFQPNFNKVVTFAYAGNLSPGLRDPRSLLNYLETVDKPFKFIIYTRNKSFLKPYVLKLGKKLELRDFVPREILLQELRKMDFLVNFENKNEVQKPSKLIDYALLERPILSIKPTNFSKQVILEFISGNYKNKLVVNNVHSYNIKTVASQFLSLKK